MSKFRLRRLDDKNIILEKFSPSQEKDDGSFTQSRWYLFGYYGKWQDAIQAVLNQRFFLIGDDLKAQLEDFPAAIERAKQEIIENITILDKNILIS